ncbi:hypothetical protein ABMA28_015638 [Loxostege sticticalis]|uniref:Uncharacterized protein n=1 Tax=Loxostege sticticalis TaxID=481309 RepID=A0ABD0TAK2_LOXSC
MKFLVLAFCVCAASAATFPRPGYGNFARATATVNVPPVVPVVSVVPDVPVYPAVKAVKAETYATKTYVNDGKDVNAEVLRSNSEVNPDGFAYNYETSNGIAAEAQGTLKELEKGVAAVVVRGQYQYQGPEGPVLVTYEANENGFQPSSDILPTPPPVPVAILRSLEYIAAHPQPVEQVKKF